MQDLGPPCDFSSFSFIDLITVYFAFKLLGHDLMNQRCAAGLTERVVQLFDCKGEATLRAVNAEEDHSNVLRGAAAGSWHWRGAVVCVALVQRELVVSTAGELFTFQNPAIKHLGRGQHFSIILHDFAQ